MIPVTVNIEESKLDFFLELVKNLKFVKVDKHDSPYNAEFVEQVLQAKKDIKQGKGTDYTIEELKELCK